MTDTKDQAATQAPATGTKSIKKDSFVGESEKKEPQRAENLVPDVGFDWRQYRPSLAEFFATAMFVWFGCGTAVSTQSMDAFDPDTSQDNTFHVSVGLAFGLAITVLVYTIAPISGGHINPAVTFAFALVGHMSWFQAARYMVAQCLGALLGAALVWGTFASNVLMGPDDIPPFMVGTNFVNPTVPLGSAFLGT
jgi:glycerol uptake facilitator-like aquaporin